MYVLLYFGGHFFLEFTRGDEAIYLGPWRLAQAFDLVLAFAAAAALLFLWWQDRAKPAETEGPEDLVEVEPPEILDPSPDPLEPPEASVMGQSEDSEDSAPHTEE
jgi:hypothetical protein